jgi:anaerobic magnesium-protoporphyrin IX monomethyl ester cyclase
MKVCLVSLPSPFLIDEKVFPNLGLLHVSSQLKLYDHEVYVHDGPISEIPDGYNYYGISSTTSQFPQARFALRHIRDFKSKSEVWIGGPHATVDRESCKDFDVIFQGEGEDSVIDYIQHGILPLHPKQLSEPLEKYPMPDREAIDIKSYKYEIDGELATTVMSGRGCPFSCAFCCNTAKVKLRPAWHVIEEIEYLHDYEKYNALMFFDDIFIVNKKRTLDICKGIERFNLKLRCFVRADLILRHGIEVVDALYRAGVREVGMGIESGSDLILNIVNKGENTDTILQAVQLLQAVGIRVKGFIIVGLPSESPKTINETRMFLDEAKLDDVDFTIFQPYKGSKIYNKKHDFDINWDKIEESWYKGKPNEYVSNVWTSSMSKNDILRARIDLEREYKKWS